MLKLRKMRRRHHSMAYAGLALIAFGLAIPAVLGSRGPVLGFSADQVLAAVRDNFLLTQPVPLLRTGGLTLDRGTLSLAPTPSGPIRSGEAVLKLLFGGNARLLLEDAKFTFERSPQMATTTSAGGVAGELSPLLSALLDTRFEQLTIKNATVDINSPDHPPRRISSVSAVIRAKRNGTVTASGSFIYLAQTLSFDATLLLGDRSSAIRLPLRANIRGQLIEASLADGRISLANGIELSSQRATIVVPDLRAAGRWLGTAWPDGPGLRNARIEGTLDLVNQTLAFQRSKIELDGNEASGALLISLGGLRPSVEGTLATQVLDISRYLPSTNAKNAGEHGGMLALAGERGALVFPVLRHFDADLRLSAGKVNIAQTSFGRSAAAITLKAGKLVADLAELEIDEQARGNAQFTIDMSDAGPRFALRTRLDNIESQAVTRALFGRPLVQGRGYVSVDLTGTGSDLSPIVGSLGGKAHLHLARGGNVSLDVAALLAGAQSKPSDEVWSGAAKGQTQFDELDASFRVTQGIWTTETLGARSGNALMSVTGLIDAPAGEVDLVVSRANAARPLDFSGASAQSTIVHVRGPWANPRVVPANRTRKSTELPGVPNAAPAVGQQDRSSMR